MNITIKHTSVSVTPNMARKIIEAAAHHAYAYDLDMAADTQRLKSEAARAGEIDVVAAIDLLGVEQANDIWTDAIYRCMKSRVNSAVV